MAFHNVEQLMAPRQARDGFPSPSQNHGGLPRTPPSALASSSGSPTRRAGRYVYGMPTSVPWRRTRRSSDVGPRNVRFMSVFVASRPQIWLLAVIVPFKLYEKMDSLSYMIVGLAVCLVSPRLSRCSRNSIYFP